MLLQRIGIEHLRIWILLLLISLVPATIIRDRRRTSDDFSIFSYDYDDKADAQDAEAAFRRFEALCSSRSQQPDTSKPSLLDALCTSAIKKQ
uniref:Secreted protein n=1 Tax=Caenorhabditis tropicalis TaxID=1561998 RepID=A0A1I7T0X3_9PELO